MNLTDEDVQEILKLLDETPYAEFKLETGRFSIELSSSDAGTVTRNDTSKPAAKEGGKRPAPAATATRPAGGEAVVRDLYPPLPGTFYRAPRPGAAPFVDKGSKVQEDTILGLVETMKLMNSVMAECRGEVIEICAKNGELVDVGDVLMRIREE
ncbi:MAG: acetyl-CoA carboxylase biotin carboxyl carrier protein subunit [Gammaproteobacteria bacterium]|nr:acetyl-CoA carboxylase biotin carboxyl carrier protein subunit [Gammaproteobacteria bacterium]MDH4255937.1 acetyl-CoA carboxylase biotin carboxyl carrier protein subunit [Gammaproteobacteria bacterium]MDH5311177.1 acetyl-CoA carboxylase biotin carboxyl carrier protein subunit [Gammaproteobacteria bacterium]